jgi:hypothetical protein
MLSLPPEVAQRKEASGTTLRILTNALDLNESRVENMVNNQKKSLPTYDFNTTDEPGKITRSYHLLRLQAESGD